MALVVLVRVSPQHQRTQRGRIALSPIRVAACIDNACSKLVAKERPGLSTALNYPGNSDRQLGTDHIAEIAG